jgi:hypothetical protein
MHAAKLGTVDTFEAPSEMELGQSYSSPSLFCLGIGFNVERLLHSSAYSQHSPPPPPLIVLTCFHPHLSFSSRPFIISSSI